MDPANQTSADPGRSDPGQSGGQEMVSIAKSELTLLTQRAAGHDGAWKQKHDTLRAEYDKLAPERDGFRTTAEQAASQLAALDAKVKELTPFQAKAGELEAAMKALQGKHDRLNLMAQHPALLANDAMRALVESSTLEGDALAAQIGALAQGLAQATTASQQNDPTNGTPPRPRGNVQRTAKEAWADALRHPLGSPEYRAAMEEFYQLADKENPYMPPEERDFAGDFPKE